ncbi:hypothetical protein EG329_005990 [Mollisiaceae sp. DMI_Dod_QoI]|nr:hypothetical protein EG329_005990 [Helotiales sp. DMI_Dod_QoI]
MARTKRRPSPPAAWEDSLPAQLAAAATPTSWLQSSTTVTERKCQVCDTVLTSMPSQEVQEHIATCIRPGPSSSSSSLQTKTHVLDNANLTTGVHDHVPHTISTPIIAAEQLATDSSSRLTTPPESPVVGPVSGEGSLANLAGLDDDAGSDVVNRLEEEDLDVAANFSTVDENEESSVKPYVDGELDYYDFEETTEAPVIDQDQRKGTAEEASEEPEEPVAVSTDTLQVPDTVTGETTPEPFSTQGSEPLEDQPTNAKVKRYGFPKLTPMENFEDYLSNPEQMSYEELYHRVAIVGDVLVTYQKEFKKIDQEIKDFDKSKASNKEKEEEEKHRALEEKDQEMWRLHNLYSADLQAMMDAAGMNKKPAKRDWKAKAEELLKNYPHEPQVSVENLANLFVGKTLEEMRKRRDGPKESRKGAAAEKNKLDLIDVPDPKLSAADRAIYARQKKPEYEDPVIFELRKMADVYGLPFKNGKVELRDRNAVDAAEAAEDENGRPKRNRNKRTTYETEQSETPGDSSEELPAKRRRTQTDAADINGSPSRARTATETREGSPAPRTFASGKRIGRPPGSKTKAKPAKSKLKQSHLPPESEAPESENEAPTPEADQQGESHARELAPSEEAQLQEAAEALVKQTATDHEVPVAPKKGKHGGARTKKTVVKTETDQPAKPARGARAKKQQPVAESKTVSAKSGKGSRAKGSVAQNNHIQNVEENDVFQSTEHDDESRFASASTSRPTTASSGATATTLGSRRATRQSTREQSKAQGEQVTVNGDSNQGRSAPAKGKAKRKREIDEPQQNGTIVEEPVEVVAPAPKKARTTTKKQTKADKIIPATIPEVNGEASANASGRQKRKRAPTITQDSIQVALPDEVLEADESTPPPPKKRKTAKAAPPPPQPSLTDPHGIYESTPPPPKASARRKAAAAKVVASSQDEAPPQLKTRKGGKAAAPQVQASSSQSDPLGIYESTPPPPKSRARNAKGKAVKQETTESEYISGDIEEAAPKTRKSRPVTRRKANKKDFEGDDLLTTTEESEPVPKKKPSRARKAKVEAMPEPEPEADDDDSENEEGQVIAVKSSPRRVRAAPKAKADRKGKGIEEAAPAPAPAPAPVSVSEAAENADGEMDEAELKAKQKSAKLSAATRARWASGKMIGPMQKRQATNEAKKAARLAAKAAQDSTAPPQPETVAGPSTAAPPAQQSTVPPPAPNPASAESSATRTSGRKRKPTVRAMGLDGADDDDDDSQYPFRSEYDHFQALSSPGTPALPKRQRKSLFDLSQAMGSEEEDEDSF